MAKIKLIKREYLGEGFWHYFRNNDTGEVIREACTKEEYHKLGEVDGAKFNPTKEGFIFTHAVGGSVDVDTPSKELAENEYTELPSGKILFRLQIKRGTADKEDIINDEIDIKE